mmetsp:Transcript_1192/g.2323  ORF Transcript_1192/g.2323 Transcript_1192/m.2323 type:complete len:192 (-) Transcript_1192:177-752(-)|eukprot:CAMPEP_0202700122 /NCGR_PEP_ID=MMETSP1385-20130828/13330_1 /ASSEMBLY_ACC=CAM_ASM_000861 /TAXON_ID=933848 /ORGANISM="Elphidium margaritaceum" /LENGTH=191 /DNA_ID=CAMNT_0049357243 /DNA_START=95 /DNA_END=670 /DNA_ORIENTATION=-
MTAVHKFKTKQLRELRQKSKKDLLKQVDELKKELHQLRVAQVSGGAPAKVANIRTTRKNIARIFTIISQITKQKVRDECKRQKKTLLPLDLRPKLTRRERLRLPNELRFKKTPKQRRLIKKFPRRKFAVIDGDTPLAPKVKQANIEAVLTQKKPANRYHAYLKQKRQSQRVLLSRRRPIKNDKRAQKKQQK